ncbi:MAG: hypothetical protein K2M00_08970 [Muribaculaceae bacterium]|nr:hypothetical protein [Muribaculaceae bacterium]
MKEHDIDFVARHYRKGAFDIKQGWRRLALTSRGGWRRLKVAATVAVLLALGATATIVLTRTPDKPTGTETTVEIPSEASILKIVRAIDFDNAPLTDVVTEIYNVYGVEIGNLPENAGALRLSLHYEGNVEDLVASINEILNCELVIVQ